MAGPRPSTNKSLQTDIALLQQHASTLEQTITRQVDVMNLELSKMNGVLKEIHDKLDQTILSHTVKLTTHDSQIADNSKAIEATNGRLTRTAGFFGGLLTAIVGGIAAWFGQK